MHSNGLEVMGRSDILKVIEKIILGKRRVKCYVRRHCVQEDDPGPLEKEAVSGGLQIEATTDER